MVQNAISENELKNNDYYLLLLLLFNCFALNMRRIIVQIQLFFFLSLVFLHHNGNCLAHSCFVFPIFGDLCVVQLIYCRETTDKPDLESKDWREKYQFLPWISVYENDATFIVLKTSDVDACRVLIDILAMLSVFQGFD